MVLQNFENSNAIVGKQSIEKGPTVETSSGDFSSIQLVDESDAIDIQFTEKLIPNSYIILLKDDISDNAFAEIQIQSFAKLDAIQLDEFVSSIKSIDFQSEMGGINHVFDSLEGLFRFIHP